MNAEVEKTLKENFTRISEGCFIESKLLKTIEGFKVRSMFKTLQESGETKFNFVFAEEGLRIWNCQSLIREIKADVKPNLVNFRFQALKNGSEIYAFRSGYLQSYLLNAWEAEEEKTENLNQ